jgi:pimeloyl-ACP methyl ester carboxylesterase
MLASRLQLVRSRTQRDASGDPLDAAPTLPHAVSAPRHALADEDGLHARYYASHTSPGRPLVLIHGVHAVASSREMAPLFEAFRAERPVYALDLPGFGASDRDPAATTPSVMERAITRMLRQVHAPGGVDVIALSLGAEYAARVAVEHPELVHALALISPTGFKLRSEMSAFELAARSGTGHRTRWGAWAGRLLYRLLTSRPSLRYYLGRSFHGPSDPRLYAYARRTAAVPGAEHAPLAFVRGALFPVGDPLGVYGRVHAPVLVVHGEDGFTSFGSLGTFVRWNPGYAARFVPHTGSLPHFEATQQVVGMLREHFARTAAPHAARPPVAAR